MSANLQTGQFYGATQGRLEAAGLVLTEVRHERGRKLPMHTHESAYFGLLLDGGYSEHFTQRATDYQPFTLGFHPPGLTHEDEIAACGSRMLCLEMRDTFWQKMRSYLTAPKFTPQLCGEETIWLCVRLYRAFRAGTLDAFQMEETCAQMVEQCAQVNLVRERSTPEWLRRAVELLHASFGAQITLEAVARELSLHPIHLSRVFSEEIQVHPGGVREQAPRAVRLHRNVARMARTERVGICGRICRPKPYGARIQGHPGRNARPIPRISA